MGLDLYLIEDNKIKWENNWPEWNWRDELCYGRKTWSLFNWFIDHSDKVFERDVIYHIPPFAVKKFVRLIEPYAEKIESFIQEYDSILEPRDWYDRLDSGEFSSIIGLIDNMDDSGPQLGYEWEARAILRWYNTLKNYEGDDGFILYGSW